MKCPYRDFKECIVEQCPSCNYEEIKENHIAGRYPSYMSQENAIKNGMAWEEVRTIRKFVSCKLIDGNVQPVPTKKDIINNTSTTKIVINKSIF